MERSKEALASTLVTSLNPTAETRVEADEGRDGIDSLLIGIPKSLFLMIDTRGIGFFLTFLTFYPLSF